MRLGFVALTMIAASLMVFAACGDGDDTDAAPATGSPTAGPTNVPRSPTPDASPTPASDGPSGIVSVDEAIEFMLAGDFEAVEGLFQFQDVACEVDVMGAGGPPQCQADEADGAEVEGLPVSQCEGAFLRADDIFFAQRLRDQAMTLYAVFNAPAVVYPEGDYAVLFSFVRPETPDQTLALELMMDDEGVTGVNFGCGEDPATMVVRQELVDAVVAPARE